MPSIDDYSHLASQLGAAAHYRAALPARPDAFSAAAAQLARRPPPKPFLLLPRHARLQYQSHESHEQRPAASDEMLRHIEVTHFYGHAARAAINAAYEKYILQPAGAYNDTDFRTALIHIAGRRRHTDIQDILRYFIRVYFRHHHWLSFISFGRRRILCFKHCSSDTKICSLLP